ncbi:MAG: nucleotidyltransferase family protein [Nitrospirota bacterium]
MNISNEKRLLFLTAQARISEDKLSQVRHLISLSLDWDRILESAFSQGVAPLLYNNFKNINEKHCIPREVMDRLQRAYHGNIARNMYIYDELLRIVKAFSDKKVKVIVLKGATLAKIVYGDIGLRSMLDIDLLVKQEDLVRAKEIMSDINYVAERNVQPEAWYRKNHYHLPRYMHKEKPIVVEIHWHITRNFFSPDIEKWWGRARHIKLNGCNITVPSPEDIITHLCLHLYNHGYNSRMILREICDINETLNHYQEEINWALFHEEINKHGLQKPVYSILYLVEKFYGCTERPLQMHLPKPYHFDVKFKLVKILEKRMLTEDDAFSDIPTEFVKSLVAGTFWGKMRLLWPTIFPPREVISKRYSIPSSSNMIFLCYLIRPFRLLTKYGKHLLTIFRIREKKNGVV